MKTCGKCGETKAFSEFYKNKVSNDGYQSVCKVCNQAAAVARQRRAKYGVTDEQFNELLTQQQGKCAICQKTLHDTYDRCLDHCHRTGAVRGILCRKCNTALGQLGDSIESVERALAYLRLYGPGSATVPHWSSELDF